MCTSTFTLRGLSSAAVRNLPANDIIYLNYLDLTVIQSIEYRLGLPFRASERATCSLHGFVFAISKLGSAAKEEAEDRKRKCL